jgi:hypothetical protein
LSRLKPTYLSNAAPVTGEQAADLPAQGDKRFSLHNRFAVKSHKATFLGLDDASFVPTIGRERSYMHSELEPQKGLSEMTIDPWLAAVYATLGICYIALAIRLL